MLGQFPLSRSRGRRRALHGVGCFFDDEMHALLGISDYSWQAPYHFTMGGAINDVRLSTCRRTSFNREAKHCEDGGMFLFLGMRFTPRPTGAAPWFGQTPQTSR